MSLGSQMQQERQSQGRHGVKKSAEKSLLSASLKYQQADDLVEISIRDLSRWGAGFSAAKPIPTGVTATLTIVHRGAAIRIQVRAKWAAQRGPDEWLGGCEFVEPLGEEFLTNLDGAEVLEPNDPRRAVWMTAFVRSSLAPERPIEAAIVNTSDSGICLSVGEPLDMGHVMFVEVVDGQQPATTFAVTTIWERPDADRLLHGCRFLDAANRDEFAKATERQTEQLCKKVCGRSALGGEAPRVPAGVLAGVALVVACCLALVHGSLGI